MKRIFIVLILLMIFSFICTSGYAGSSFKCPPNQSAVQSFCKNKFPNDLQKCITEVSRSDCSFYKKMISQIQPSKSLYTENVKL
jgi:thioredoxin-related protein